MTHGEQTSRYRFEIGQIVHHRRYHYRGVIFECDPECQADEAWYRNNQTQPDRTQPWYNVLVDGSRQTTYVAESNLELDHSARPIVHPLLNEIFHSFLNGQYHQMHTN